MTTPEQPRQRFWQQALEELFDHPDARDHAEQTPSGGGHSWRCIPIAEAIESVGLAIEAQARPAVASEGLRAALERLMDVALIEEEDQTAQTQDEWIAALQQASAALASDAGSVGALDVERLARALEVALGTPVITVFDWRGRAAAVAAAYDAERQGES